MMGKNRASKFLSVFLSMVLVVTFAFPTAAIAVGKDVLLTDDAASIEAPTQISGITISGVDAPQVGVELDGTAIATASNGESWEIPVLWVGEDLQICTHAQEGQSCLPVLLFFVPEGYSVDGADEGGAFTVSISEELVELFGGQDVITAYDNSTGTGDVTYIMPATLEDYFSAENLQQAVSDTEWASYSNIETLYYLWLLYYNTLFGSDSYYEASWLDTTTNAKAAVKPAKAKTKAPAKTKPAASKPAKGKTKPASKKPAKTQPADKKPEQKLSPIARMVNLYCSNTAKKALSQTDLEYLVDLIVNKLQPQAVNLLLEKFPSFKKASGKKEIGSKIGLYIYYKSGDNDKDPAHNRTIEGALAYVGWDYFKVKNGVSYQYIIGVDAMSCVAKDKQGNLVKDKNGNYTLSRSGSTLATLGNTLVHEMFHAFMDDYNRAGMVGSTSSKLVIIDIKTATKAQKDMYAKAAYPKWFVEGTASAVENNYMFRRPVFEALFGQVTNGNTVYEKGSANAILYNYLHGTLAGKPANFSLNSSYNKNPEVNAVARYATGYLAALYLGELAARANPSLGTSIVLDANSYVKSISSERIRLGLDSILERMHKGETLDQIIASISPVDTKTGKKLYSNTDEFEDRFILGPKETDEDGSSWYRGGDSLAFVRAFLGYMDGIENDRSYQYHPNGSILFDFAKDYNTPLDATKNASSDYYRIANSNTFVPSTVPDSIALAGGGMSASGTKPTAVTQVSNPQANDALPLAAKAPADPATNDVGPKADAADAPASTEPAEAAAPAEEAVSEPEPIADASVPEATETPAEAAGEADQPANQPASEPAANEPAESPSQQDAVSDTANTTLPETAATESESKAVEPTQETPAATEAEPTQEAPVAPQPEPTAPEAQPEPTTPEPQPEPATPEAAGNNKPADDTVQG